MNVLLVDDSTLNLKIAKSLLKGLFTETEIILCNNPLQVSSIMQNTEIDIILLDIIMPEMNGMELLEIIRSQVDYDDIQILMMTGINDKESLKLCFELGANDYINKPLEAIEFRARIKNALKTRTTLLEIKKVSQMMLENNARLESTNKQLKDLQFHLVLSGKLVAIGELAAGVAHEINNPLGYIGSNLETLRSYIKKIKEYIGFSQEQLFAAIGLHEEPLLVQITEEQAQKYKELKLDYILSDIDSLINESYEGFEKASTIVHSLKSFARKDTEENKDFFGLSEAIEQALLISKNELKYKTEVIIELYEEVEVYANKGQIEQVLINLLVNAAQAIESQKREKKGRITIRTKRQNNYAVIEIEDDGPGIDNDCLQRIFDPFYTTKDIGVGTGLGLSISHDIIVQKHKGILEVESDFGRGTLFRIQLPLEKELEVD